MNPYYSPSDVHTAKVNAVSYSPNLVFQNNKYYMDWTTSYISSRLTNFVYGYNTQDSIKFANFKLEVYNKKDPASVSSKTWTSRYQYFIANGYPCIRNKPSYNNLYMGHSYNREMIYGNIYDENAKTVYGRIYGFVLRN